MSGSWRFTKRSCLTRVLLDPARPLGLKPVDTQPPDPPRPRTPRPRGPKWTGATHRTQECTGLKSAPHQASEWTRGPKWTSTTHRTEECTPPGSRVDPRPQMEECTPPDSRLGLRRLVTVPERSQVTTTQTTRHRVPLSSSTLVLGRPRFLPVRLNPVSRESPRGPGWSVVSGVLRRPSTRELLVVRRQTQVGTWKRVSNNLLPGQYPTPSPLPTHL